MKKTIKSLLSNTFIKVSGTNGIVTLFKSILTIIANKVVATIIGSAGIAMIGQLQNFMSITSLLSNGGFNQGLTKYIAEKPNDEIRVKEFISTAFVILTLITTLVAIVISILSKEISVKIFSTDKYFSILILFALTLFFFNVNALILSIVNGFQLYKKYFRINITITIIGFLLTVVLVYKLKEYGALLAIVLSQSIVCLFSYFYVKKSYWINAFTFKYFSKEKLFLLLKYTTITFLAAIIWPIVSMIIRTYVINNISAQEAGLWQATYNINEYIVNIAVGSFSVYLLPKLSSIKDKFELRRELITIYKIIIPVTLISFLVVYLLRDLVVVLLYSKDFLKVGHYLLLQMLGSFFWMCKIPITNYLLAKGHIRVFLTNEITFAILYITLAMVFIPIFHVQGIQMAFAIYNLLYLIVNIFLIRKYLK